MKTSLAIVFAAYLMLSATVATAHFKSYSGKSPGGVSPIQIQVLLPSPPGPGPYRGNR